jgi:hypothetical protein
MATTELVRAGCDEEFPHPPSAGPWTGEPPFQATIGRHRCFETDRIIELLSSQHGCIFQANGWIDRGPGINFDLERPAEFPRVDIDPLANARFADTSTEGALPRQAERIEDTALTCRRSPRMMSPPTAAVSAHPQWQRAAVRGYHTAGPAHSFERKAVARGDGRAALLGWNEGIFTLSSRSDFIPEANPADQ